MKYLFYILTFFCLQPSFSQLITKTGYVSFYSELEEVLAENFAGESELDTTSGKLLFSFPIQSFYFENATMQKHFNEEDVMHSKKFPRAKFVGKIDNLTKVNFNKIGKYNISVSGNLTIKETTKEVQTKAEIIVEENKIIASATFNLNRHEYGVNGKDGVISDVLEIKVKAVYEKI